MAERLENTAGALVAHAFCPDLPIPQGWSSNAIDIIRQYCSSPFCTTLSERIQQFVEKKNNTLTENDVMKLVSDFFTHVAHFSVKSQLKPHQFLLDTDQVDTLFKDSGVYKSIPELAESKPDGILVYPFQRRTYFKNIYWYSIKGGGLSKNQREKLNGFVSAEPIYQIFTQLRARERQTLGKILSDMFPGLPREIDFEPQRFRCVFAFPKGIEPQNIDQFRTKGAIIHRVPFTLEQLVMLAHELFYH